MNKQSSLIVVLLAVAVFASCSSGSGDSSSGGDTPQGVGSAIISNAPTLKMELVSQAVNASLNRKLSSTAKTTTVGEQSVGGCLAWAVRKNVKVHASPIQYMQCLYHAASDAGLIELGENETVYLNMGTPDGLVPTRIVESEGTVTIGLCYGGSEQENLRVVMQESANGYVVTGTSVIETGEDDASEDHTFVKVDTSVENQERYDFIDHVINETSADLCSGPSGVSLTENDTTCFLRYEGELVNDTSDTNNPSGILNGVFAEKNSDGTRTISSVYSKFSGGNGASLYSAKLEGVNADVNETTAVESWSPTNFVEIDPVSFIDDVSGQTLSGRTVTLPSIDDPWDCEVGDNVVTINYDDYSSSASDLNCDAESMQPADMTNCTGGDEELSAVIEAYLCDTGDPLIDISGSGC